MSDQFSSRKKSVQLKRYHPSTTHLEQKSQIPPQSNSLERHKQPIRTWDALEECILAAGLTCIRPSPSSGSTKNRTGRILRRDTEPTAEDRARTNEFARRRSVEILPPPSSSSTLVFVRTGHFLAWWPLLWRWFVPRKSGRSSATVRWLDEIEMQPSVGPRQWAVETALLTPQWTWEGCSKLC